MGVLVRVEMMPVLTETTGGQEINWCQLGMCLFAGIAFFLFGMEDRSDGLKAATGETLKVDGGDSLYSPLVPPTENANTPPFTDN